MHPELDRDFLILPGLDRERPRSPPTVCPLDLVGDGISRWLTDLVAVSKIGIQPVDSLSPDGEIGDITKKLQEIYFGIIQGRNPDYLEWCTPVYSK